MLNNLRDSVLCIAGLAQAMTTPVTVVFRSGVIWRMFTIDTFLLV